MHVQFHVFCGRPAFDAVGGFDEGLYAADLAYLQEFYNRINRDGKASIEALCPKCAHEFEVALDAAGGS